MTKLETNTVVQRVFFQTVTSICVRECANEISLPMGLTQLLEHKGGHFVAMVYLLQNTPDMC